MTTLRNIILGTAALVALSSCARLITNFQENLRRERAAWACEDYCFTGKIDGQEVDFYTWDNTKGTLLPSSYLEIKNPSGQKMVFIDDGYDLTVDRVCVGKSREKQNCTAPGEDLELLQAQFEFYLDKITEKKKELERSKE